MNSIIQEVREIREQHAANFDFDLDRIFIDIQARQKKHEAEGWRIIPVPSTPPIEPNLKLQRTRFVK